MPLSSQQLADILLAHWQLLWRLPPAERIKMIDEIRADYEYEETQQRVMEIMAAKPIFISDLPADETKESSMRDYLMALIVTFMGGFVISCLI